MNALYSLAACIIVLAAYAAGYIRGHRRGREQLDDLLDGLEKKADQPSASERYVPLYERDPEGREKLKNLLNSDPNISIDEIVHYVLSGYITASDGREAMKGRDRRYPLGSNLPVRWDDTQPIDAPTEHVQPTKPWRQE